VRDAIASLKSIDLTTVEIDSLKEMLIPLFEGYIKRACRFAPGLEVYRAVKYDGIPDNIAKLKYPPKAIARNNRASREGYSVFYSSTFMNAPFFEVDAKPGDTLVLSKWKTLEPLMVNNIGYTSTAFSKLGSSRQNPNFGALNDITQTPSWNSLVDEFLDSEFSKIVPSGKEHEHLYKLSIAIAEKMFLADMFDGLLYPTIAMRGNVDNLAIKARYVDEVKLKFVNAKWYRIDSRDGFQYKATETNFANSFKEDGTLEWKGRKGQWFLEKQRDQLTMKSENGVWVARDKFGNIVEPE
jgi:hypothetical protein